MKSSSRATAAAFGVMTASSALLFLTPGAAVAQEGPPEDPPPPRPCRPEAYPPENCRVVGGAGHDAPPVVVDRTVAPPGTPVAMRVSGGCLPGAPVTIALVRMTNGAGPVGLQTVDADANGGYDTSVVIPANASPGVYILYSSCRAADSDDVIVSTTSFVIVPAEQSNAGLRTSSSSATSTRTTTAKAVAAEELPETWSAPASWRMDTETKAAVTEAVNYRLAAMRTAPAAEAPVVTPQAAAPTDLTPWFAAGGAVALLAAGAAGWRRRATAGSDEAAA